MQTPDTYKYKISIMVTEEQNVSNSLFDALDVIGGKWKLCVIVAVREVTNDLEILESI